MNDPPRPPQVGGTRYAFETNKFPMCTRWENAALATTVSDTEHDIEPTDESFLEPAKNESLSEPMDESLWGTLPEDIQDRILAWLPFPAFARACTVCKRWNSILCSESFLEMYRQVPCRDPCFLMFEAKDCSMCSLYNPALNCWHQLSFSFFQYDSKFPVCAGAGLLCFCGVSPYPSLFVVNPFTKNWKELPPMVYKRFPHLVGIEVDDHSRTYKIIAAGDYHDEYAQSTEVYDSVTNSWDACGDGVPLANYMLRNACADSVFYCLTGDPYGVIKFNMQNRLWSELRAHMPPFLTSPHLVGCHGRLFMVGGVKKQIHPRSIRIWELQQTTMDWEESARMPSTLCTRFLKDSRHGDFMCVGHKNLIFLTSYKCSCGLMYDLTNNLWRWLPACPLLTVVDVCRLFIGFPFSPRFDTPV